MKKNIYKQVITSTLITFASLSSGALLAEDSATKIIESSIVSIDSTHVTQYDGSVFHSYFNGNTNASDNVITGVAIIEPNNEIHPAHKHEGEEYLMILEGAGTWSLDGKESPAKQGDILYVSEGVMHGIFNSGDVPLKFVVVRYTNKASR